MEFSVLTQLFYGLLVVLAVMVIAWLFQYFKKDAGIVDVAWAACIGLLTLFYACTSSGWLYRKILVAFIIGLWSFRLSYYLFVDRVSKGKEEDGRYRALRLHWGEKANINFFYFFIAQALLALFLSITFLVLIKNPRIGFSVWEFFGFIVWVAANFGEAIADRQLSSFRSNAANKGKTCKVGLWRFSRHPNYFFEWLQWIGYALMGIGVSYGWFTILSAVLMYFFLTKLTGIPYTEIQALKSRGDDYRAYQQSTSAFFPWFPKG